MVNKLNHIKHSYTNTKLLLVLVFLTSIVQINAQQPLQFILAPHFVPPLNFQNDQNTIRSYPALCGYIGLQKTYGTRNAKLSWSWSVSLGTTANNFRYLVKKQDFGFLPEDKSNIPDRNFLIPYFQPGFGISYTRKPDIYKGLRFRLQVGFRFYSSYLSTYSDIVNATNPPNGLQFLLFEMEQQTRIGPLPWLNLQVERTLSAIESKWFISGGFELFVIPVDPLVGNFRFFPGSVNQFSGRVTQNASSLGIFIAFGRKKS